MSPRAHPGGWETPAPGRPVLARGEHRDAPSKRRDRPSPSFHDMVSRLSALESAPVFFGLPDATLRTLARRLRRIKVSAGDMIVFQGEPGDTIFIIERGRFRIVIEKPPSIVTVALLSEGDFFGEGAAVLNRSQQASVYAQTDGYLLALDKQALHSTMSGREHPALEELRQVADRRFRAFADTSVQATWGLLLQEATVVGVYSPKGGSGGTCISLNLVGALARRYPGEVLLLDLDFPYSHSALLAGLVPTSCLARISSLPQESFEDVLLSTVLYDSGGPMILPGALRPEEADEVTPELVNKAIATLRKTFRYIAVDGAILSITNPKSAIAQGAEALAAILEGKHARPRVAADSASVPNGIAEHAVQPS